MNVDHNNFDPSLNSQEHSASVNSATPLKNLHSSTNEELAGEPVSLPEIEARIAEACTGRSLHQRWLNKVRIASVEDVNKIFQKPQIRISPFCNKRRKSRKFNY